MTRIRPKVSNNWKIWSREYTRFSVDISISAPNPAMTTGAISSPSQNDPVVWTI